MDCVIGHGAVSGRQVQIMKNAGPLCKWIQVVHTAPEELGMFKEYEKHVSRGQKKHETEVKLCEKADKVVAVDPSWLKFTQAISVLVEKIKIFSLLPQVFFEFADVKPATEERQTFSVLVFGRGDKEDFQLKGYDIAACAIAELKDEPKPYKLLFVGGPSGEEETVTDLLLEQGIDRRRLTVRRFCESREQLRSLFRQADLVEALSAGLPVLVSGNSGLGEALKEVQSGSSSLSQRNLKTGPMPSELSGEKTGRSDFRSL